MNLARSLRGRTPGMWHPTPCVGRTGSRAPPAPNPKEDTMAITRSYTRTHSPWQQLDEMNNRLGRLLLDPLYPESTNAGTWMPAVNVEETPEHMILTAELPGLGHEDIDIQIENNVLTLSGEKRESRESAEDNDRRYHMWERRWGRFERAFTLPRTVRSDDIEASFADGVLTVHMPKAPEARGRRVEVRPGV
ncbi:MAG: Hsp20/alpha crystallin family protein [Gemmatimonadales bacterium]|nr:MAG: Hsp20/alpha crystallin family protein [Gemmatimonadales bacterium]